jgi:hypothetical protein
LTLGVRRAVSTPVLKFSINAVHHQCMAVTEGKAAERVARYRRLIDSLPQPPDSLSLAPDSRLHVIVERAGAKPAARADLTLVVTRATRRSWTVFKTLPGRYPQPTGFRLGCPKGSS